MTKVQKNYSVVVSAFAVLAKKGASITMQKRIDSFVWLVGRVKISSSILLPIVGELAGGIYLPVAVGVCNM